MNNLSLLDRAYRSLIEDIAGLQTRIIAQDQINELFGDLALPVNEYLRGTSDNFSTAPDKAKTALKRMTERHRRLVPIAKEVERILNMRDPAMAEEAAAEFISRKLLTDEAPAKRPLLLVKKKRKRPKG